MCSPYGSSLFFGGGFPAHSAQDSYGSHYSMFQPGSAGYSCDSSAAMDAAVGFAQQRQAGRGAASHGATSSLIKGADHGYSAMKQVSPSMDDTFAAVVHGHLGCSGTSPLECAAPPDYWTAGLSQHEAAAAFMPPAQPYNLITNAPMPQQQQQQCHLASSAAAAAGDPNTALYACFRAQHPQAYAEADRLSYGSEATSTAAIAAAPQHQQDMLAAERAFQARQLAQLQMQQQQQQQLAYQHSQHALHHAQLQQQQRSAAAAASNSTSALFRGPTSSNSTLTQQHPAISYSHQPGSMQPGSSTAAAAAAARLPPRPHTAAAHGHHYHPYSTATGAPVLEHPHAAAAAAAAADNRHHQRHSLAAAAAAARAAAIQAQHQQQQQVNSRPSAARQTASAAAAAAAAALQRSTGRWSGAVAVLDQGMVAGTQASVNEQHCSLECDEELLSMDGLDQDPQPHSSSLHAGEVTSAGSKGALLGAAAAAAAAAQHRAQLQGGSTAAGRPRTLLSGAAAQHTAAGAAAAATASAAARAAAAGYALSALEEEDAVFDMCEDSGSTHPDSDNQSDDMDADTAPVQDQQPRRGSCSAAPAGSAAGGQPGSSSRSAAAAAASDQHAAAASKLDAQAISLHVLSSVANRRKGEQVLTAHASVAEAAGAHSVRIRLLITEVSLYCENSATSVLALQQGNKLMSKMALPDGITYMPVSSDSFLFKAAHAWQFPAFVICLGSSYMQRMLAKLPQLADAACTCPGFEDYCRYLPNLPAQLPPRLTGEHAMATTATLRSVLFTCLFIATKVADQVHALGLLRFILTHLSHNGVVVTLQQAIDVEARCLDALDWRLGPFFVEDELTDDDLELWCHGMGHWDYGSPADLVC